MYLGVGDLEKASAMLDVIVNFGRYDMSVEKEKPKRYYCSVCCRQIVHFVISDDKAIGVGAVTHMGLGTYCCHECAKYLDEFGLFPEEREKAGF